MSGIFRFLPVFLLITLLSAVNSFSQSEKPYIPEQLQAWVPWVMERHPQLVCPPLLKSKACVWPGKLLLQLDKKGGNFTFHARLDIETSLPLPGGKEIFPINVVAQSGEDRTRVKVLSKQQQPYAFLPAGEYIIEGEFRWKKLPKTLPIPVTAALLEVNVAGSDIEYPHTNAKGELWLQEGLSEDKAQEDSLTVEVYRKLTDDLPFKITTLIKLRIAGKIRELQLGKVIPAGATPVRIETDLNYSLKENGALHVRGKPGIFDVSIETFLAEPPSVLSPARGSLAEWPAEEIWVWIPNELLRSVAVEGGVPIDPGRTSLPAAWQGHSTYIVGQDAQLKFSDIRRGETERAPNNISLKRTLWLDLDGEGFTARDEISGTMNRNWRLNSGKELQLGRVTVNGQDQLITEDPQSGQQGVELRTQALSLIAEARMEDKASSLPAIGWDHNVSSLSILLNLPPGWSLFEAVDVDSVSKAWLRSWNLLDIFLVILAGIAAAKLLGIKWGVLTFVTLVLIHRQAAAPLMIWFHLLAGLALLKYLPDSSFKGLVRLYYYATLLILVLIVIAFSFQAINAGIFPQVGSPSRDSYGLLIIPFYYLIEKTFIGWIVLVCGLWGWVLAFSGSIRRGLLFIVVSGFLFFFIVVPFMSRVAGYSAVDRAVFDNVFNEPQSSYQQYPQKVYKGKMSYSRKNVQATLLQNAPGAVVQTGLGVPSWGYRSINLSWSGAVRKDHRYSLYLISPFQNLLLAVVRVLLLFALSYGFLRGALPQFSLKRVAAAGVLLLSLSVLRTPAANAEDFPDQSYLKELEQKLLLRHCKSNCTAINDLSIKINGRKAVLEATVSSRGPAAVPLPGPTQQFYPDRVMLDGTVTNVLRREKNGHLWVRVDQGVHRLQVQGRLLPKEVVTLQFPINPQFVEVTAPGWQVDGVSASGSVENSLQLTRAKSEKEADQLDQPGEIYTPPWYDLKRELGLGLPWKVFSELTRIGNKERPTIVKVALLPGESVTSEKIKVQNGIASVYFPRGKDKISWESTLEPVESLTLQATTSGHINESWNLSCSAIWRCTVSGIAPINSVTDGESSYSWRPYPGEEATIEVFRPQGSEGKSITIDKVDYLVTPGIRLLTGNLTLRVRSSQGGFQPITLPPAAVIKEISVNGRQETTRHSGLDLSLPLSPGTTNLKIDFEMPAIRNWLQRVPSVKIGNTVTNVSVVLKPPPKRWILFVDPDYWGPAVLFWSKLIVVVIFALIVGATRLGGMGAVGWVLLGLGTATLPVVAIVIPVVWFAAMQYRKKTPFERRFAFNLGQLCLVLLTFVFLMVLYQAVKDGLLIQPNMMIRGASSSWYSLRWYVDFVEKAVPTPWVFSAPMWIWRLLMLLWSSWLVFSLLRWLRWGYECFSDQLLWKAKTAKNGSES